MSDYECEICGSTDTTPVWEDLDDYEAGAEPDRIGCRSCGTMEEMAG